MNIVKKYIYLFIFMSFFVGMITFCSTSVSIEKGAKPTSKSKLILKTFNRIPYNYEYTDKKELKLVRDQWVCVEFRSPANFVIEIRNDETGESFSVKNIKGRKFYAKKYLYLPAGSYQLVIFSADKPGLYELYVYNTN